MKHKLIKLGIISLLIISAFLLGAHASKAYAPDVLLQDKPVEDIIVHFARENGQNPDLLLKVAKCESSLRYDAVGDSGKAYGILQFHQPTFERYEKLYGEDLDYHSSYDQAKLAAYMFSIDEQNNWSCYKKVVQ